MEATIDKSTLTVSIKHCARCGADHSDIKFKKLIRPSDEWSYWAPCPFTGEPIMLAISDDDPRKS